MKITLLTGKTFDLETAFDFNLRVLSSFKYKRLTLRIDTKNAQAVLSIPKLCSKKKAYEFVVSKQEWIIKHLSNLPKTKDFEDGETFSLFGQNITVCHLKDSNRSVYREDNNLFVGGDIAFLHRRIKDYIKREAKKEFFKLSKEMAGAIDCHVENVFIKDTKSRWGSCSSLNNINYNWRIMLAPLKVIDYLVAHEVSHLEHQDHSTQFWNCVDDLAEDLEYGKNWLKKNGRYLNQYI